MPNFYPARKKAKNDPKTTKKRSEMNQTAIRNEPNSYPKTTKKRSENDQ